MNISAFSFDRILAKFSISRIILLGIFTVFIFNFASGNMLKGYLILTPTLLFNKLELWRLISYPFQSNTILGTLLFIFTFLLIAPKCERKLTGKSFLIISLIVVILNGLLNAVTFAGTNTEISGTEALTFFCVSFYFLSERTRRTKRQIIFSSKLHYFLMIFIITWITAITINGIMFDNYKPLITSTSAAFTGICAAIIIYYHLKIRQIIANLKDISSQRQFVSNPDEVELVNSYMMKKNRSSSMPESDFEEEISDEEKFTEEKLNLILDKLNTWGEESLSYEEKKYLRDYSDFLNK